MDLMPSDLVPGAPSPAVLSGLADVVAYLQDASLRSEGTPLYLRICRGEAGDQLEGPSWDHEANVQLPGWSVIRVAPEAWWPRRPEDWVARRLGQYNSRLGSGREGWLVSGQQVGVGTDHEPLLVHLTYWARIERRAFTEAERVYNSRFERAVPTESA
ncbi:MAG: DUF6098 family protein [Actinomycetes bacterium]